MKNIRPAMLAFLLVFAFSHSSALAKFELKPWKKKPGKCGEKAQAKIDKLLGQGIEAYQKGSYQSALVEISKARAEAESSCPESGTLAWVIYWQGRVLFAEGRHQEAEKELDHAISLAEKTLGAEHSKVIEMLWVKADLLFALGRYPEAEELCGKALALAEKVLGPDHPEVAQCLDVLGRIYSKTDRYNEAKATLERSLKLKAGVEDPVEALVHVTLSDLGNIYYREGDYRKAEEYYQKSLEIYPYYYKALHNLAALNYVYARKARDDGDRVAAMNYVRSSIDYFQRAIAVTPNAASYNDLGSTLMLAAELAEDETEKIELQEEAISNFDIAISLDPALVKSYVSKAIVEQKLGRSEEAIQMLKKAIEVSGGADPQLYLFLCAAHAQAGHHNKAVSCYDECLTRFPENEACETGKKRVEEIIDQK